MTFPMDNTEDPTWEQDQEEIYREMRKDWEKKEGRKLLPKEVDTLREMLGLDPVG